MITLWFFAGIGFLSVFCSGALVLIACTEYQNNQDYFFLKILGFGVLYVRSQDLAKNVNAVRETEGRSFFITAPFWFNKYVYNFGVRREPQE